MAHARSRREAACVADFMRRIMPWRAPGAGWGARSALDVCSSLICHTDAHQLVECLGEELVKPLQSLDVLDDPLDLEVQLVDAFGVAREELRVVTSFTEKWISGCAAMSSRIFVLRKSDRTRGSSVAFTMNSSSNVGSPISMSCMPSRRAVPLNKPLR
jgi:hypothetical protein